MAEGRYATSAAIPIEKWERKGHEFIRLYLAFLIDGAPVPDDAASYQRIVLLFDGEDEEAVVSARAHWSEAKAKGFEATYWQPDDHGRWTKKA